MCYVMNCYSSTSSGRGCRANTGEFCGELCVSVFNVFMCKELKTTINGNSKMVDYNI